MKENIRKYIGNELRSLRAKNNISLVELANILKIDKGTICKYENAVSSINIDTLEKFLNYYNIDFDIFFSNVCANKHNKIVIEKL